MHAMVLNKIGAALEWTELADPQPGPGEIRVKVSACGVCRTDLHVVDGELPNPKIPIIPGHEIVGRIDLIGNGVEGLKIGERVGIPWLGHTCGVCPYCLEHRENLCNHPLFTGYTRNGGFATMAIADARFAFPLGETGNDVSLAPLLCAGLIGWRSLVIAGNGKKIGLYGFGAAAHIISQVAKRQERSVFAFTRPGDNATQVFARSLGATWAGGSDEPPPEPLDAAIIFATVGQLVPLALKAVRKGGRVVCAGIHMSDIPSFPYSVWLRAWEVQVGRAKLYLLDSNDAANFPAHRGITSELYGGGPELRLKQEMLLGIGGWQLLMALGLKPDVCHLNEGHAAFAVLERARTFMQENSLPFEVALAATRAGNLFTTHTAVAAGFDRFTPALIEQYLGNYATEKLGISLHDLLALGRQNPNDPSESFNMAYLAIRGSGSVNGVSRLHGQVSRQLFSPLFPRWPVDEVPVGHVTNGVHHPTWDSAVADDLWTKACGKDRWLGMTENLEQQGIRQVTDERLWQFRAASSKCLVEYARERLARHYAAAGASSETVEEAKHLFNPDVLTLGFARRFATYKRPNLLLRDPERLLRLLSNPQRPVQLMIAGKAHPADKEGQALIKEWIQFIRRPDVRPHAIFLSDYDMHLTERLVQGVDVWLNTPRRPWEACGTSGMKVLVNGGLNLSELDGWWAEAYVSDLGWALGDGKEHGNDSNWDASEYDRLGNEPLHRPRTHRGNAQS